LITERCDAAGFTVKEALEEGTLNQVAGTTLLPHVYVPEVISLLNKLDQIGSGFMYQTQRNPRLCDGCTYVHSCVADQILPYTAKCKVMTTPPATVVNTFKQNARMDELIGLLETILEDETNKVIVWASYKEELNQIEAAVKGLKVKYVRVEGGMGSTLLDQAKTRFNTDRQYRVYIGQISTGIGITLNAANYTIYYNLPWSLEHYQQSLDRNYRIGQQRKVTVYRLVARYTLDEAKVTALNQKMDFSTLVTVRAVCAVCPEIVRCTKHNIELYDDDCIYDRTMMRNTAQVRLIP
jgi:SNF2 family DNA or RNA helicase